MTDSELVQLGYYLGLKQAMRLPPRTSGQVLDIALLRRRRAVSRQCIILAKRIRYGIVPGHAFRLHASELQT